MVVGARLLAAADDTVAVWSVRAEVADGASLSVDMLAAEQVRFADAEAASLYVPASAGLPERAVAGHALGAGELLPRTAVVSGDPAPVFELPVVVGASGAPEDLNIGEVVDVWVVPETPSAGSSAQAQLVVPRARVLAASRDSGPLGESATRQVLLGLDAPAAASLQTVLSQLSSGTVVLIRQRG